MMKIFATIIGIIMVFSLVIPVAPVWAQEERTLL